MLAALAAPRPLLLANSDKDKIFPLDGVLRIHSQVKRIYDLLGATNHLGLLITEGPHEDTQDLQVPVFRWFNRFLKGEDSIIDKAATNHFATADLKVFAQLPEQERTSKIHETFVASATSTVPTNQTEWNERRDHWKKFLAEKVFITWPTNVPAAQLRSISTAKLNGIRFQEFDFVSQENITLPIYVVTGANPKRLLVRTLDQVEWDSWAKGFGSKVSDEFLEKLKAEIAAEKEAAIAFILPRGIGPTAWRADLFEQTQIRRRFMLLGTTLDAMRVWDIRRAIEALGNQREFKRWPIELRSSGEMGVNALYASLFETSVKQIQLSELPASHSIGPDYLNVLKSLDIPQALAMAIEKSPVKLLHTDSALWDFPISTARHLGWTPLKIEP